MGLIITTIDNREHAALNELLAQGTLRPIIDRVMPLDQINDALQYSHSGHATGKIVIEVATTSADQNAH
ncbi:zinc-binding dehydrogenase [Lactiplantibacillus pentosus]|uniref:zinc-binding dehydrogenase n=1 Tax=Lactiplantibacillus pentosus TaxID=1589 RepID=UPI003C187E29